MVRHEKVFLPNLLDDIIELTQPLAKSGVKILNQVCAMHLDILRHPLFRRIKHDYHRSINLIMLFVLQMPVRLPSIIGDPSRIIQIFYNLIGNATKFTHTGKIWVTAKTASVAQASDPSLPLVRVVEVTVHDTGIGIPEDKFSSIFEAFEQVDQSTTRKYGGTGLGLTLVKQLVEAHDGTITVSSEMGKGTSFTFTLKEWTGSIEEPQTQPTVHRVRIADDKGDDVASAQHNERITAGRKM